MDKKIRSDKFMKIFEDTHSSSDDTPPDPYSDDGVFGSDRDYDPGERELSSDSSTSNFVGRANPRRGSSTTNKQSNADRQFEAESSGEDTDSNEITDINDYISSSSDSIFECRVKLRSSGPDQPSTSTAHVRNNIQNKTKKT
jgi:hypothetical protein